jgi:hypothetical protein
VPETRRCGWLAAISVGMKRAWTGWNAYGCDIGRSQISTVTDKNQSSNTDFLGYKAIATIETPRPIRWLTVDGTKSGMDQVVASHIRLLTRRVIASTLIIVDIKRIDGLRWEQIGDYVTMVALANPKLGADYSGQDSILSLFSGDSTMAPAGLTANDRTLLTGLYSSKPNQTAENQRAEMRRARTRALKAGAKALPQDQ